MPFAIPDDLKQFSAEGLADLVRIANDELVTLRASVADPTQVDEPTLARAEELASFLTAAEAVDKDRADRAARFAATQPVVAAVVEPVIEPVASATEPVKDTSATTTAPTTAGEAGTVVAATVTHSSDTQAAPIRSVQVDQVAPNAPAVPLEQDEPSKWVIRAAADGGAKRMGEELSWEDLGKVFSARSVGYSSNAGAIRASGGYSQTPIAQIERVYKPEYVFDGGTDLDAYKRLDKISADFNNGTDSVTAGIAWCAPSPVDYSTCNPIQAEGLLQSPEILAPRGGVRHNQGLAFSDFFGGDFVLPITGYNILTETQVIADTAKTCFTIPCPPFVDDRLNVAALCLTGNILQNRAYPEFVAEFTRGATAAMAHLVNREIINEIVTGSTAVNLSTVDPWITDGSVVSQVLSAVELAVMDLRYFYRAGVNQRVSIVLPLWLKATMRADWIRRNGFQNSDDLADAAISAMFALRGADVQFVMDFQDGFNPTNGAGAIIAGQQLGSTGQAVTNRPWTFPTSVSFLAYLPGTWVVARNNVIRLDMVYDSTKLATNQVTQLFVEDGYKPMRMCTESRYYTVPICANGSTGVQRAVACADVTP
jgi:hypothetical protein